MISNYKQTLVEASSEMGILPDYFATFATPLFASQGCGKKKIILHCSSSDKWKLHDVLDLIVLFIFWIVDMVPELVEDDNFRVYRELDWASYISHSKVNCDCFPSWSKYALVSHT